MEKLSCLAYQRFRPLCRNVLGLSVAFEDHGIVFWSVRVKDYTLILDRHGFNPVRIFSRDIAKRDTGEYFVNDRPGEEAGMAPSVVPGRDDN